MQNSYSDICTAEEIAEMNDHELRLELSRQKELYFDDKIYCLLGFVLLALAAVFTWIVQIDPTFDQTAWLLIKLVLWIFGAVVTPFACVIFWRQLRCIQRINQKLRRRQKYSGLQSVQMPDLSSQSQKVR